MLNLDTHILLSAADETLDRSESSLLRRMPEWRISAIVLWEIELLRRGKRIAYGLDSPLLAALLERIPIWPLDAQVCLALRDLDFRSDPADEIIAATTLAHRVPLVTRDARLRGSKLLRRRGLLRPA